MNELIFATFYPGRLLTAIVTVVVAFTALSLGVTILRENTESNRDMGRFWFVTGLAWFTVAFRSFASAFNMLAMDRALFEADQALILFSGVFLGPFLFSEVTRSPRLRAAVRAVMVGAAAIGTAALIISLPIQTASTPFATKYVPNMTTLFILRALIFVLFIVAVGTIGMKIWRVAEKLDRWHAPFASLSIAIYLFIGLVDESGVVANAALVALRLVFLLAFVIAYIAFIEARIEGPDTITATTKRVIEL